MARPRDPQDIIAEVGATIASSVVLEDVLGTIVRQIGEALGAGTCDIHDYDAGLDRLTFVANWALDEDPAIPSYIGTAFSPAERPSFLPVLRERLTLEAHVDDPGLPESERVEMERWHDLTTLDAPLVYGDEVIGVLGLTDTRVRHYSEGEHGLFSQLAVLAAIAIHNARAFRRQEEQNRHLAALLDASRALTSTVVLEDVLALVADKAAQALDATSCAIMELRPEGDLERRAMWPAETSGDSGPPPVVRIVAAAEAAAMFAGGLRLERGDDRLLDPARRRELQDREEGVRLTVPLVYGGEPLGLMWIARAAVDRSFSDVELELASALGDQAAAAIQNAHQYRAMQHEATTDGLTGLFNYRYFHERLHEEVARAHRYALPLTLLMLDIDDFKAFNDQYGHQLGDEALRAVGSILRSSLRQNVDIAARYGGEEFTVILPSTGVGAALRVGSRLVRDVAAMDRPPAGDHGHAEGAATVAERLRHDIEAGSATVGSRQLPQPITVSVGIAELVPGADDPDRLVAGADRALYAAKAAGKNRVVVAG